AAGDLVVGGECGHTAQPGAVPAGQVVDHVQVVRTLLQQQAGAAGPVGVPVLEVEVPAVADEVPAPDRLDLPDLALVDDLAHRAHHLHVPHVVPDVQRGAAARGCLQHRIGIGGGDRHRLFQVHRYPGAEQLGGHCSVRVVRTEHQG